MNLLSRKELVGTIALMNGHTWIGGHQTGRLRSPRTKVGGQDEEPGKEYTRLRIYSAGTSVLPNKV